MPKITWETDPSNIPADAPLRLSLAARIAFPDGGMTVSGLRRERDRGRLIVERVAGKEFTTLASIQKMRELCRVEPKQPSRRSASKQWEVDAGSAYDAAMAKITMLRHAYKLSRSARKVKTEK